jgi:cytoskeletal protein CcmA (bactofilin family)
VFAKEAGSRNDRIVASTQEEIRRLARDGNALQSEAASSIGSGLSIVGKIIGHGALTIFGHVEGEVRASTIVIAEGAQIEGEVSAEELTIGGYVKGTIHANRVQLNSTAVVEGDIFHRTLVIEGSDASMKSARAIVRWNRLDEDKWERRHVEIERARKLLQRR